MSKRRSLGILPSQERTSPLKDENRKSPLQKFFGLGGGGVKQRSSSLSESSDAILESCEDTGIFSEPILPVLRRGVSGGMDAWAYPAEDGSTPIPPEWKHDVPLIARTKRGYTYEFGIKGLKGLYDMHVTDQLKSVPWYLLYFYGKDHANYIGSTSDSPMDTFIISVIKEDPMLPAICGVSPKSQWVSYKIIVRTKDGDMKKSVSIRNSVLFANNKIRIQDILEAGCYELSKKKVERVKDDLITEDLKYFEDRQLKLTYKVGVLYCAAGQTAEEAMYCNEKGSPDFEEFLDILGDRVKLQGFPNFKGGLDVKTNTTGEHSVYTRFNEYEMMFHVSTMLPYDENDPQQVERKRHLGNDVVVIVFKEGDQMFEPSCIKSHFNHVFIVISKVEKVNDPTVYYKISIASKEGVHPYLPQLPAVPIIVKSQLRDFLLCKVINGEDAAMNAPSFKMRILRTRMGLIEEISTKLEGRKNA